MTAVCAGNMRGLPSDSRHVYATVMSKAEEYRKLAEEAQKRADAAQNPTTKQMYLQLADSWRELATQAERQGR